jgi:predicted CoA-binding protein
MPTLKEVAADFLAQKRIAITGVSRHPRGHGSNVVYQRLRGLGYQVYAVNPNTETVEGDPCYRDLASIPGGVDAVVIGTRAETAQATVEECARLGILRVWMHRSMGPGCVSPSAAAWGRDRGISVIEGGCPLMYGRAADVGHKVMRFVCALAGTVPRRVA